MSQDHKCQAKDHHIKVEVNCCGCSHDTPSSREYTAGDGIIIEQDTISAKISKEKGNALEIRDGALYVPNAFADLKPVIQVSTQPAKSNIEVTAQNGDHKIIGMTNNDGTVDLVVTALGLWKISAVIDGIPVQTTVSVTTIQVYTALLQSRAIHQYGVRWDRSSSTKLIRLGDAASFSDPSPAIGSAPGTSPFDACMPWSGMRVCNIVDGVRTFYEGEPGFSRTPSTGDVMVEIPKFWIKTVEGTSFEVWISDSPVEGYVVSPLHMDRGDGHGEREVAYVSAYTLDSSYRSVSGQQSIVSVTRQTAREQIHALGNAYWQFDYTALMTLWMLYLVEFSSWDSQEAIGMGNVKTSGPQPTGTTDGMAGCTGTAGSSLADKSGCIKYRGIENVFGNIRFWVDGIVFSGSNIYVCIDPRQYGETTSNYSKLSFTRATSNSNGDWVSSMGVDSGYPWALYPSESNGGPDQFIPDMTYHGSGTTLHVGGSWGFDESAGLFFTDGWNTADYAYLWIGTRSIVLPA